MTKFAHADSNTKLLEDWPASRGRNLYSLGMYWTRTAVCKWFLALLAPDLKDFCRTNNTMICNIKIYKNKEREEEEEEVYDKNQ